MPEDFVTLAVVKTLLESQANAFKAAMEIVVKDVKEEVRTLRNEVKDLTVSLQFTQAKMEESQLDSVTLGKTVTHHANNLNDINDFADRIEGKLEYLENQSRRNNIKLFGINENRFEEKTWSDTEKVVKSALREKLGIQADLPIERCHRVNHATGNSRYASQPRPIVAKFSNWKDKEFVLKKARTVKPEGVKFVADFARSTLPRREELKPQLRDARANGKIAYFVMDRLVVKDKPPDNGNQSSADITDATGTNEGDSTTL